ncbi:hypothetical protein L3C95_13745 [Chitinophaga filiformis]|uniref:hypothetical protein n=1 Tax=Chitinophaga filiformis TaxID=104663 RepID=UPI001F3DC373|nr:hypothetical protein [Chitinophaga filiformis]MCF6403951.1 hypothetical protein [Chitinophaga filiformis]
MRLVFACKELREAIGMLAGGINARFRAINWPPINYWYKDVPTAPYVLYTSCMRRV